MKLYHVMWHEPALGPGVIKREMWFPTIDVTKRHMRTLKKAWHPKWAAVDVPTRKNELIAFLNWMCNPSRNWPKAVP